MIEFKNVSKVFGANFNALRDVSFSIDSGEIFGIIGESGAGKSTALRLMNGLESPTAGVVAVNGNDIASLSLAELRIKRREISVIFQGFNLLSNQTVLENMTTQILKKLCL